MLGDVLLTVHYVLLCMSLAMYSFRLPALTCLSVCAFMCTARCLWIYNHFAEYQNLSGFCQNLFWHSLFRCCTASMEQATNRAETARFVVIRKHFCFILSMGTRIRIDSVMRPQSSSKRRNASVTVTVTGPTWGRGTPFPPCPFTSPSLALFYFSLFSLALTIFFFGPSLSFLPE